MLTKNLTPFLFGAKVTSRRPPAPEMTLIVKGTFDLRTGAPLEDQGKLSADVFAEADVERAGEVLVPGDLADFKLNAEVLFTGACHTPGARPLSECGVRFAVGAWSKELRVVGPRTWTDSALGRATTEPAPFTVMPLSYGNAFGGPDYPLNPAGRGLGTADLPTVENPGDLLRARSQRPHPASFGPINAAWPPRAGKVGKEYGKDYVAKRAPYYAVDFDWTFFHAAPGDQQIEGYLRGDEEVTLQNLVAGAPVLAARLPGLRIRAFVKDTAGRFREVGLSLDTLFVDGEAGTLSLTWRGVDPVLESDLTDVAFVLVASESLADKPGALADYEARLHAFAGDPVGLHAAMPPELLAMMERQRRLDAGEPLATEAELLGLDPISKLVKKQLGPMAPEAQAKLADTMKGKSLPPEALEQVAANDAAPVDPTPSAFIKKPGAIPPTGVVRRQMRSVLAAADKARKAMAGKPIPPEELAKLDELEKLPLRPEWVQVDPSYRPPLGPISTDEPGPGKDLSEQDLTGRDLSGMDLSYANLTETILTKANLRGCKLVGANLSRAVLYKADFTGANLTNAVFTNANAARARLVAADLTGATLEMAFFEGADLTDAKLVEATGEYATFPKATLAGVVATGARLPWSDFTEARLERASFKDAVLARATFESCRAEGLDLTGADLSAARFPEADLTAARFTRTRGARLNFTKAKLDGADFTYAWLLDSHFTEVSAKRARFGAANLKNARFYRADLEGTDFGRANLLRADLCKTQLGKARFPGANLYDAKLLDAAGLETDFSGANLKRASWNRL